MKAHLYLYSHHHILLISLVCTLCTCKSTTLASQSIIQSAAASQVVTPGNFQSPFGGSPVVPVPVPVPDGDSCSDWSDDEQHQHQQQQQEMEEATRNTEQDNVHTADHDDTDQPSTVSSQPLQTLKKLQQMLDETDYMTTTSSSTNTNTNTISRPEDIPRDNNSREKAIHTRSNVNANPNQHHPFMTTNTRTDDNMLSQQTQQDQQQQHQHQSPPDLPPQYLYDQQQQQQDEVMIPQQKQQTYVEEEQPAPKHPYQQQQQRQPPPSTVETAASQRAENQPPSQQQPPNQQQQQQQQQQQVVRPLWTSKDRSKYKKMQQMQRRAEEERRRLEQHLANTSDDEQEGTTDTDDGLGSYTLPNFPVYMSDAEGEGSDSGEQLQPLIPQQPLTSSAAQQHLPNQQPQINSAYAQQQQQQQQRQDLYLQQGQQQQQQQQQQQYTYPAGQQYPPPPQNMQQPPPFMSYGAAYPPYMPYYNPQQQQQQQQQPYSNQQQPQQPYSNPQQQQLSPHQQQMLAAQYAAAWGYPQQRLQIPPSHAQAATIVATKSSQEQQLVVAEVPPTTLAEATSRINFDSLQKISLLFVSVATLSYCAVSPRNLQPLSEYNRHFYDNLRLMALCTIVPLVNFLFVCDARENDINSVITSFYTSFTFGYALAFIMEILLTTVVRLGVFCFWEPNIFKLSPKVPILVLPWVLRENKYRPKRITLFLADFLSSCVASPIIEEYVKLKMLQLSVRLPRNFQWCTKVSTNSKNKKKRKRRVAEAANKNPGVTNINSYVTHMLAVSLGIKLCDSFRRILMYTKASHPNKSFYAVLRGMFPIHELCGTMTALGLAKRDVLGVNMPLWKLLFPAVFIHGMANFRGMKPLFKWNAATPWSEMQLSPWNAADDSTLPQLINKGFAKLMWLIIQGRVLGYCIKNYYLISRQARKRTTTYAGKQAAFSAELEAAEMLKKTKDK